MQDGAPPHYLTAVRDFLNDRFTGQWISRDAPIAWPPFRRPDTPRLFLLGFHQRYSVLPPMLAILPELRARIDTATEQVTHEILA